MKKWFTVTEILITIGIVGVVAALVLPQMVSKINRSTVGITLDRAVELHESGFARMINAARENAARVGIDDAASISKLSVLTNNMFNPNVQGNVFVLEDFLIQYAQSYIGLDHIQPDEYIINLANAGYFANAILNDPAIYRFKKINAFLMFEDEESLDNSQIVAISNNPDIVIRKIFFDTNGEAAPNTIGEDICLFGLTDSGHLVPAGSNAYTINLWDAPGHQSVPVLGTANFPNTCIGSAIPPIGNPSARLSCTARVVRDGWRVNYSY